MSISLLRQDYSRSSLSELDVASDPIVQFSKWFEEARQSQLAEPNAMSVATVGADGRPSSRILLLKEFDHSGFTWFTNYESRKGQELVGNPYAALLFHWIELERQVRIEGRVERVSAAESDCYFQTRPVKSRLGAIASQQSRPIANRQILGTRFVEAEEKYGDQPPRPEHWGGYRLVPDRMEFWQGRSSRMHDRILLTLEPGGLWQRERLQP
ncbi:pyridoxamine 5'-phosphate oxidase [Undibacterium arcticum]|uniref:Pyridoxine/pyridoxamine 5'-phosphate oxidase n=1 Tax=Undibacterium arcticum TaxID=1762892 RepID=A0ABV7F3S3_9BURK